MFCAVYYASNGFACGSLADEFVIHDFKIFCKYMSFFALFVGGFHQSLLWRCIFLLFCKDFADPFVGQVESFGEFGVDAHGWHLSVQLCGGLPDAVVPPFSGLSHRLSLVFGS